MAFKKIRITSKASRETYTRLQKKLGEALYLYATDSGRTASDVSREIQTSRQYVSQVFRGEHHITFKTLLRFCKILNLRVVIYLVKEGRGDNE